MENSTVNNLSSKCDSIEFIGDCVFNNVNILKCNDMELCEYSSLTTGNVNINSTILQCQENSEINDTIDRFKWLASIKNIVAYNNFKLKYNGKLMYQQLKKSFNINIEEELISITNNISRKRR